MSDGPLLLIEASIKNHLQRSSNIITTDDMSVWEIRNRISSSVIWFLSDMVVFYLG